MPAEIEEIYREIKEIERRLEDRLNALLHLYRLREKLLRFLEKLGVENEIAERLSEEVEDHRLVFIPARLQGRLTALSFEELKTIIEELGLEETINPRADDVTFVEEALCDDCWGESLIFWIDVEGRKRRLEVCRSCGKRFEG